MTFIWTASSEFGTYRLCEQRRFRQACASAQSRQNLRYSLIQAVSQEEPSDRKPDPWPLWMAGHAQLKFVMTECSKTQIRLTGLICFVYLSVRVVGVKSGLNARAPLSPCWESIEQTSSLIMLKNVANVVNIGPVESTFVIYFLVS